MSDIAAPVAKPLPPPSALSAPYWEGAKQGKLMLQSCASCAKTRHYPQLLCPACHSAEVRWLQASGRGLIHSWTVAHHAFHPGFRDELPYTLVTVDLPEGVRALGRYPNDAPLSIGQPVCLRFENDANGTPGLVFEPAPA